MSDWPPFYRTAMGREFFDATVPKLVRQLERIADRLPEAKPERPVEVDDLRQGVQALLAAVDEVLETEIVPGGEATKRAFRNLRARAGEARRTAEAIR